MKTVLRPALLTRNGAGVAESKLVHRLPSWRPGSRLIGLVILTAIVAAFLAYMVANVPVMAPRLSRADAVSHWRAALIGALVVLAYAFVIVSGTTRGRRRSSPQAPGTSAASPEPRTVARRGPAVPRSLTWERIPRRAVVAAALLSSVFVTLAAVGGFPLWVGGLALVVPWLPLVAVEGRWKYAHYGVLAAFAMLVLLQVVHMGEHSMQVGQLLASQGDLATSHGVFGQLDFELVHFVTDTTLWLSLGLLLLLFYSGNRWLWVAFAAASLHQVEHFYLFWLNRFHESVYAQGGFAGIMGNGGMIGSPLDRPYLHFTYNFIVTVPMVIALWDQARRSEMNAPT